MLLQDTSNSFQTCQQLRASQRNVTNTSRFLLYVMEQAFEHNTVYTVYCVRTDNLYSSTFNIIQH